MHRPVQIIYSVILSVISVKSVVNQFVLINTHNLITKKFAIFLTTPDSNSLMNPVFKIGIPAVIIVISQEADF